MYVCDYVLFMCKLVCVCVCVYVCVCVCVFTLAGTVLIFCSYVTDHYKA